MKHAATVLLLLIAATLLHARWTSPQREEGTPAPSAAAPQYVERRAIADSLPRENRIQSIREAEGGFIVVVELASDQRRLDIGVYNLLGKRVATVYLGKASAGIREYPIPTAGLPNGIYICVAQGDGFRVAHKFVLSR